MTTEQVNEKAPKKNGTEAAGVVLPVIYVAWSQLVIDEGFNHRLYYDDKEIDALAANIKSVGQLNPLTVRKKNDGQYHIVAGHRRYKAIGTFKDKDYKVMVHVKEYEREDLAIFDSLAEGNRSDVSNYELAVICKKLEDKYGTSRKHIAKMTGKTESEISQLIGCMTDLTPAVKKAWEASIAPEATTDAVAKAADIKLDGKDEVKMSKVTNRKSGEIPISRLTKWKGLESSAGQKAYLAAYLDGDKPVEAKDSGKGEGKSESKGEDSGEQYVPPTKKEIREHVEVLESKKKEDGKLSEEDMGRYKALRWVLGKISRLG